MACAALAWASVGALFERARRRLGTGRPDAAGGSADLLSLYAEGIALALAGLAIALPPVSFLALIAFAVLLVRGRRDADSKYAGLRVLR